MVIFTTITQKIAHMKMNGRFFLHIGETIKVQIAEHVTIQSMPAKRVS